MSKRVFDKIAAGLKEAIAHAEGRGKGVRVHHFKPLDVKAIRERVGLTQEQFSARFGVSLGTLRHWERGDRQPHGTARVLLTVIGRNPKAVLRALEAER
ncbi:MAG: helix-turn-helix domain-containing protein [Pseudomonadota bacterium]